MTLFGATIGGAIGIVGIIIGSKMSRSSTLEALRITDFNRAAADFRSILITDLYKLKRIAKKENPEWDFVPNFIEKAILRHKIAFMKFEPYLPSSQIPAYRRAWEQYSNPDGINEEKHTNPLNAYWTPNNPEKGLHLAISNLERLMKFAKPK